MIYILIIISGLGYIHPNLEFSSRADCDSAGIEIMRRDATATYTCTEARLYAPK